MCEKIGCCICFMEFSINDDLLDVRVDRHTAKHQPRHSLATGEVVKVNTIIGEVEWYTV